MNVKKKLALIQVLLIIIFAACAVYVGKYFYDSHAAKQEYDVIRAKVEPAVDASGNYEESYAENGMLERYFGLYGENNDFRGWIKIDGTAIDYPVVQAADNDYYLHRDFYGNYRYSGIPFLDCQSADQSSNYIIYAHNMKDGTMFADIYKYENRQFYQSHKEIIFDTLYDHGVYDIISVFSSKVGSADEFKYHEYADIETEDEFNEYVKKVKSLSVYNTGLDASYGDRLITLSTCAYHASNQRFVVVAKKREEQRD